MTVFSKCHVLTLKIVFVKYSFTFLWDIKFVFFFSSSLFYDRESCRVHFIVHHWLMSPVVFCNNPTILGLSTPLSVFLFQMAVSLGPYSRVGHNTL